MGAQSKSSEILQTRQRFFVSWGRLSEPISVVSIIVTGLLTCLNRAGDAAHSFPPTGGLGLNSGLGDVHNLAYKIALVLQGKASERLLDSYDEERRQVAIVNSIQSVKNGKQIFGLLKTLGIGEDAVRARRNLYASLGDPDKKREIDEGIEAQREHFDNVSFPVRSPSLLLFPVLKEYVSSLHFTLATFTATNPSRPTHQSTFPASRSAQGYLMHGYVFCVNKAAPNRIWRR